MCGTVFSGRGLSAAIALFLLAFLVPDIASAQIIRNVAEAQWTKAGQAATTRSNEVTLERSASAIDIGAFVPAPGGTPLPIAPSLCNGSAIEVPGATGAGSGVAIAPATRLRVGQTLVFTVAAPFANRDPGAVESIEVRIEAETGDREQLTVFETTADSGIFGGAIATHRVPPTFAAGDCRLGVAPDQRISIIVARADGEALISLDLDTLADPFGVVFDSEDGTPVDGARVSLVDANTGRPATVFAEDGVTPWPSTVISGQPITDAAGNVYPMPPGEYWFPLAPLSSYRIEIIPPSPYTAPSVATPEQLALLTRPEGGPFLISPASYGQAFPLDSLEPVQVDIPLDRPNVEVSLTKTASRPRAAPGEAVFYTVTVRNPDIRPKRDVSLTDTPSDKLRLRPDSVRIDGEKPGADNEGAVEIAPDGRRLTIRFGSIPAQGTSTITYAMTVREDAAPGQATNRAVATDRRGGEAVAEAAIRVERDTIASRMTIVGRVTMGDCGAAGAGAGGGAGAGLPGVRVMLEDGSFAVTDRDGRYHFEGVVPGTHVVQAQRQTLPAGARFVDCNRSTRSAGSASSLFAIGQGGSLVVADFTVAMPPPESAPQPPVARKEEPMGTPPAIAAAEADFSAATPDGQPVPESIVVEGQRENVRQADGWLAMGAGPPTFLLPAPGDNPRTPALVVVVRHGADQTAALLVDGKPVAPLAFDGTATAAERTHAVSVWRGVELVNEETVIAAVIRAQDGSEVARLEKRVDFVSTPWQARIVPELSRLVADGSSPPVIAIRLTDRKGRPVREGISGSVGINAPYESAVSIEQMQVEQLSSRGTLAPNWIVEGNDGIALVELAPTMISGPLHLDFAFADREITRRQTLDSWVVPGDQEWTVIGLAEGTAGARSVADNMQRSGDFDSDLGENARVALYAKGRVLGRFLLTAAYDSAAEKEDRRLLGTIDPNAYYTVFGDGSDRRFDAASTEKLYVRVETGTFYALYGDFVTGFEQTRLARYQRTVTGLKAEGVFGPVHVQGFAAKVESRFRRDVIQGSGLTGPYRLTDRDVIASSELVAIEVRDRQRPEIVIERRDLTRFVDYDLDLLAGTIRLREPLLSRDITLNPQFLVIDYEVMSDGATGQWNAGGRGDITLADGALRVGASVLSDEGDLGRTTTLAGDLRARVGADTEIRAELAHSSGAGEDALAWLVEAEHHTGALDILAYATSIGEGYGTGQQDRSLVGRRKIGADARVALDPRLSIVASAWIDDSLSDEASRRAIRAQGVYRNGNTDLRLGVARFDDTLPDGTGARSTVLEAGATQRLLGNRLEVSALTNIALDDTTSVDLPARHQLRARYAVARWAKLIGQYETASGETLSTDMFSGGVELNLWEGGRVMTTLGRQSIDEYGRRNFAAFGVSQTMQLGSAISLDATLDGNRKIGGADIGDVINPAHPVSSGGHLGQDGTLFEDFTAATLGAAFRRDVWSATVRGEYRDGEFADRLGATAGVIRQIADGTVLGSGFVWTRANAAGGASSEIFDGALSFARRPADSPLALLAKLEYRSDEVAQATLGGAAPVGNTALTIAGSGASRRLLGSLSANWQPFGRDDQGRSHRRTEVGTFLALRHQFDGFGDYDLATLGGLAGLDTRIGIGERIEIGGQVTVRANLSDDVVQWSAGPQVGVVPTDGMLLTLGYNLTGFHDRDFVASRNLDRGLYVSIRAKIDADSFNFLGLGRR